MFVQRRKMKLLAAATLICLSLYASMAYGAPLSSARDGDNDSSPSFNSKMRVDEEANSGNETDHAAASVANNGTLTNYAQHDKKLIKSGADGLQITRSISNTSKTASGSSSAGLSLTLLLVLLALITLIISIILGAVFVMRRRFTIWRLHGNEGSSAGDGDLAVGTDACDGVVNVENKKTAEKCETKVENEKQSEADNNMDKKADAAKEEEEKAADDNAEKMKEDEKDQKQQQQPSPATSETRLLNNEEKTASYAQVVAEEVPEKTDEKGADADKKTDTDEKVASYAQVVAEEVPQKTEEDGDHKTETTEKVASYAEVAASGESHPTEQSNEATSPTTTTTNGNMNHVSSSSSLIANVLNEITDSVTSKMTAATKSMSKTGLNQETTESDKEPLNQ